MRGLVVPPERKTRGFFSRLKEPAGLLSSLLPFSRYKMFMVVANNHHEGPQSNTVEFTTKEGGEQISQSIYLFICTNSNWGA